MKAFLFAAALALPTAATAQSAKCLTPPEAQGLITYALPSAIRAISGQCAKTLPATASLIQTGPLIAARYQPDADRAWPLARNAFDKMSGIKLTETLGEAGAKGLLETAFSTGLADNVKPKDCPVIDRILAALEPLPAKNMSMLLLAAIELGGKGDKKPPLSICAASATGN